MASKFLGGFCQHSPAEIVELWVKNPWGIPKKGWWERDFLFSTEKDFHEIKSAGPGITSFAVQIVQEQLDKDIRKSVKKTSGLHTFTTGARAISDDNYGAETFEETTAILKESQPLAWNILEKMATPLHNTGSVVAVQQNWPPEMVWSRYSWSLHPWLTCTGCYTSIECDQLLM